MRSQGATESFLQAYSCRWWWGLGEVMEIMIIPNSRFQVGKFSWFGHQDGCGSIHLRRILRPTQPVFFSVGQETSAIPHDLGYQALHRASLLWKTSIVLWFSQVWKCGPTCWSNCHPSRTLHEVSLFCGGVLTWSIPRRFLQFFSRYGLIPCTTKGRRTQSWETLVWTSTRWFSSFQAYSADL